MSRSPRYDVTRGECVLIQFPYHEKMVTLIKTIPSAAWCPEFKCWELRKCMCKVFVYSVKRYRAQLDIEPRYNIETELFDNVTTEFDFSSLPPLKTNLFDYQIDAVKYGVRNKRFILGDEPGLGKTLEIIGLFHYLRNVEGLKKALIICGINGNKYNWLEEIEKHSNYKAHVLGSRRSSRTGRLNPGGLSETIEDLRNPPDVDFYILNIERLRGGRVKRKRGQRKTIKEFPIVEMIQTLIYQGNIGLIAFDESHKAKTPSSAQTQALMWLDCPRQIAMTGTLVMNSPLDLYVPFKWMGWEFRDYWSFTNRYAVKDTWGSVIGYQNAQELIDVLNVYQLRRLKRDVLKDLPEKIHIDKYFDMSDDEWKCYKAIQLGLFNMLNGVESNPQDLKTGLFQITPQTLDPMTMSLRLRQCTADTSIISDVIKCSSKLDLMEDIIEEELSPKTTLDTDGNVVHGKVIIFSNWTTVTNIVRERLSQYNPAYITGEIKDSEKNEARVRFQTDPNCRIIIGTIPAMGTGFTLDAATAVIFLDEPWTKAMKDQAEDRAHRAATKHSVNVYTLMAKDTVDENVHEVVEQKGDVADLIVDGVVNPNKRMQMMKILLGADRWNKVEKGGL